MDCLILSAGLGTRLLPVSKHIHKSMIPFWGKPFLEYTVENITADPNIDRLFFVVHHLEDQIKDHFGQEWNGIPIEYLYQESPKGGTADAVSQAKDVIKSDFIVVLSDVYLTKKEVNNITTKKGNYLAVAEVDDPENHKIVEFDKNKVITNFSNVSRWADIGLWRFNPKLFNLIEKARPKLKTEEELKVLPVLNLYLDEFKPKVLFAKDPWVQIGDHEEIQGLIYAKKMIKKQENVNAPKGSTKIKNSNIEDSIVFGPSSLKDSTIINSLVYLKTDQKNIKLDNKIKVL